MVSASRTALFAALALLVQIAQPAAAVQLQLQRAQQQAAAVQAAVAAAHKLSGGSAVAHALSAAEDSETDGLKLMQTSAVAAQAPAAAAEEAEEGRPEF